jgi:hypothetical protein
LSKRDQPCYLDSPIILKSGQQLTADSDTEIRLKPGSKTCKLSNEYIIGFADTPGPWKETNLPLPSLGHGQGLVGVSTTCVLLIVVETVLEVLGRKSVLPS